MTDGYDPRVYRDQRHSIYPGRTIKDLPLILRADGSEVRGDETEYLEALAAFTWALGQVMLIERDEPSATT